MDGRVPWAEVKSDGIADRVRAWRDAGATHVSINTTGAGLRTADEHVGVLEVVAEALAAGRRDALP
jgi:hypothetical protein